MKWTEQIEPERIESLASLCITCGLSVTLELLAWSQEKTVCVWFAPTIRLEVQSYLAHYTVEAGGLLIGRRFGPLQCGSIVSIEQFVPGTDFNATGVSLALGTKVWDHARLHLDSGYVVVGWVHSHPNLGAFFSGTDRKTQRAFFSKPWQLGLCIDPVRRQEAWFYGADSLDDGLCVLGSSVGGRTAALQ